MASAEHPNLELLTLVWIDYLADATQENREVQTRLRTKINYLRTFDNCQDGEHYIRNVIDDKQEKIVLIVSGRLGPDMTQRVHDLKQVVSIYVYCLNKEANEEWAKKYKKVGVSFCVYSIYESYFRFAVLLYVCLICYMKLIAIKRVKNKS